MPCAPKNPLRILNRREEIQSIRADEGHGFALHDPARHDDGYSSCIQKRVGDCQAVGDDGKVTVPFEVLSERQGGAAGVEKDGIAIVNQGCSGSADAFLFGNLLLAAQGERQIG